MLTPPPLPAWKSLGRHLLLRTILATCRKHVYLRVDDFPHWKYSLADFLEFNRTLSHLRIPYTIAVTPMLSVNPLDPACTQSRLLTDEEVQTLQGIVKEGCTIALHGLTHRTEFISGFMSEFSGISAVEAEDRVLKGIDLIVSSGLPKPTCFIPPFNTFDANLFSVFERHFDLIVGGPESVWHTPGKEWIRNAPQRFACSCSPLYGRAERIQSQLLQLRNHFFQSDWLTLHWTWERQDDYQDVKGLLKLIKKRIVPYGAL